MKNIVLFIVGPTATGKSSLAFNLAQALKTEIISADSMQIYRGMNIGTAKATVEEQKKVKHHLIDICDPSDNFTVYDFREKALAAIAEITRKKKIPVIAGGTGLYIRSLLEGLSAQPGEDAEVRERLERELKVSGIEKMYHRLLQVDPSAKERMHSKHERRIIRALEIYELTGRPATEWYEEKTSLKDLGYSPLVFSLRMERPLLNQKIDERVEHMFKSGLLDEIRVLLNGKWSKTALQAVGYKEVIPYLESAVLEDDAALTEVMEAVKKNTRALAKRQMTWFRKEKDIEWLDVKCAADLESHKAFILEKIQTYK